jgi:hypothetical protein
MDEVKALHCEGDCLCISPLAHDPGKSVPQRSGIVAESLERLTGAPIGQI